jgi:hypothetical protein
MQQVKASIREHHALPVAFLASKLHNRLFQCQNRGVQRLSMFVESWGFAAGLNRSVYHARGFAGFSEPAA